MNKIIWYITIFIIFYLQISIFNPNVVNANASGETNTGSIIIPDASPILTGTTLVETPTIITTGSTLPTASTPIEPIQNTPSTPIEIETYFVVSAYYSPLPDQAHYLRGNYEDEVILNGRWLRWSSWKAVFEWMLAAPKTYNFWTKIYLEWLWVWEVSDRWWAIVSASGSDSRWYAYDRIDVWMWFWEEWLKRALAWWKKTVKGKVLLNNSTPVSVNHASLPAPESVVKNLVYKPHIDKSQNPWVFSKNITPESGSGDIKELQEVLSDIWLYESWVIDGNYQSIKDTLIDYQIKVGIVTSRTQDWAWYFWPKTSTKLMQEYAIVMQNRKQIETQKKKIENELATIKLKVRTTIDKFVWSIGSPKVWDVGVNVRNLQKSLKTLWYLKAKDSAIYGIKTKEALINYQLNKGIIASRSDPVAGVFWPKTKEAMKQELLEVMETKYLQAKKLLSYAK